MAGPLEGVRVIELAHVMAGPVCGRFLADMGADVVKVERPDGDPTRRFVPPYVEDRSAAFVMLNRNKRGIVLDLKTDAGQSAFRTLVDDADVLVENYRSGTMSRMNLGYEELAKTNPRLVYCQVTGFGRTGPMAAHGGFDLIAQGYSGLMSITGEGDGRPPTKCGPPITDITAGILAALGVVAALHQRSTTGKGQRVDTSLFEAGVTQTFWQSAIALATGESPGPLGSAHPLAAPYEAFETSDGWINVGGSNQATWRGLAVAVGLPHLIDDPRFESNAKRMEHLPELRELLQARLREHSSDHWLEALRDRNVPVGPVLSVGQALAHPQALARDMVVDVPVGKGMHSSIGLPIKFSENPSPELSPPPDLGEHTRDVLSEAGVEESLIYQII